MCRQATLGLLHKFGTAMPMESRDNALHQLCTNCYSVAQWTDKAQRDGAFKLTSFSRLLSHLKLIASCMINFTANALYSWIQTSNGTTICIWSSRLLHSMGTCAACESKTPWGHSKLILVSLYLADLLGQPTVASRHLQCFCCSWMMCGAPISRHMLVQCWLSTVHLPKIIPCRQFW